MNAEESKIRRNASFALLLPGKVLHLSALIVTWKFRDRGNKAGALEAMQLLDDCGMEKLRSVNSVRGTDKASVMYTCKCSAHVHTYTYYTYTCTMHGFALTKFVNSMINTHSSPSYSLH